MFDFFYNRIVRFTASILPFVGTFNKKIRYFNDERIKGPLLKEKEIQYWFHCASMGEYEMALPIIDSMSHKWGQENILITFFSPSGFNYAIEGKYEEEIRYLPLDTKANVNAFYDQFEIVNAVFVRYDLWYNYLKVGLERKVKFYLLNARFGQDHALFKRKGKPYFKLVKQFEYLFCSDAKSHELCQKYGLENSLYVGDTRFERVAKITRTAEKMPDIEAFVADKKVLCLGSSWPPEEALGLQLLDSKLDIKVIIAPHSVAPERINEIEELYGTYNPVRYSNGAITQNDRVLILDNIGMLARIYRYSNVALVGGGFSGALHNIMEPAAWGNLVYFGPNISKFPEASLFIDNGLAKRIEDEQEWISDITAFLSSPEKVHNLKEKGENFILESRTALLQITTRLT